MSVSAVQNYENRNPLSTVINSTIVGGVIGYGAKYAIPLRDREKKDINYKAVVNASRKDANLQKVNSFKVLKSTSAAQDEFIRMIDNKENFKNPSLQVLAERLGGNETPVGQKILAVINDDANKGIDLDGVLDILGKQSDDVIAFDKAFTDKEAFKNLSLDEITKQLGGEDTPIAKKVLAVFKENGNKSLGFESVAAELAKNSPEAKQLKHVSRLNNCFANENINYIVKKLGGDNSQAGKEFRRIISEVDQSSSQVSRKLLQACHKVIKEKRYASPLIIAGAAAGFAAAFIHNVFSTKTEA